MRDMTTQQQQSSSSSPPPPSLTTTTTTTTTHSVELNMTTPNSPPPCITSPLLLLPSSPPTPMSLSSLTAVTSPTSITPSSSPQQQQTQQYIKVASPPSLSSSPTNYNNSYLHSLHYSPRQQQYLGMHSLSYMKRDNSPIQNNYNSNNNSDTTSTYTTYTQQQQLQQQQQLSGYFSFEKYSELLASNHVQSDPMFQQAFLASLRLPYRQKLKNYLKPRLSYKSSSSPSSSSSSLSSSLPSSFTPSSPSFPFSRLVKSGVNNLNANVNNNNTADATTRDEEEQLLFLDLYEKSIDQLPTHVRYCMSSVCDSFVVIEPTESPAINMKAPQVEPSSPRNLVDIDYEVDSKLYASMEEKKIQSKKHVPATKIDGKQIERMKKVNIDPSLTDLTQCINTIHDEYDSKDRSNFLFESVINSHAQSTRESNLSNTNESSISDNQIENTDLILQNTAKKDIAPGVPGLLFLPKSIRFQLNDKSIAPLEDIICSVTIYNYAEYEVFTQVTETFTFLFSQKSSLQQKALFLTGPTSDNMIIFFKLARRYKGELSDLMNDLYIAGDKAREKDIATARSKAKVFDSIDTMYSYFAWGAVNLKYALSHPNTIVSGIYLLPSAPGNISNQKLLASFVSSIDKNTRVIPGTIELSVSKFMSKAQRSFGRNMEYVVEYENNRRHVTLVKSFQNQLSRILDIENVCIIQPSLATIRNSVSKKSRTLQIVVSLCDGDSSINQQGMKVFYPILQSAGAQELVSEGYSFISVSNDSPEFSEEIKFKIPLNIGPNHHLLFRFYNIQKSGTKELIGYSFLRLLNGSATKLVHGPFELDFFKIKKRQADGLAYLSSSECKSESSSFKVHLQTRSVAFPNGSQGNLEHFFDFINREAAISSSSKLSKILQKATSSLASVPHELRAYAPMVLNYLFRIIESNSNFDVRTNTFHTIMEYVSKSLKHDLTLVKVYIKYYFKFSNICEALLIPIQSFVEEEGPEFQEVTLQYSWFILSVLLKSILLQSMESGEEFELSPIFLDSLEEIIVHCFGAFIKRNKDKNLVPISGAIGNFLMRLLSVMNNSLRPHVMQMAVNFYGLLASIFPDTDENALEVQLAFFDQLFAFDHYEMLFLPQTTSEAMMRTRDPTLLEESLSVITYNHFIYTAFADLIVRCLDNPSRSVRMRAITFFKDFVNKTNSDERFQDKYFKERINQIHFEFIQRFLYVLNDWSNHVNAYRLKITTEIAKCNRQMETIEGTIYLLKMSLIDMERQKSLLMQSQISEEVRELETSQAELQDQVAKSKKDLRQEVSYIKDEKRLLLATIMHILRNMNEDVLSTWFMFDSGALTSDHKFIDLLQMILLDFEYPGKAEIDIAYGNAYTKANTRRKNAIHVLNPPTYHGTSPRKLTLDETTSMSEIQVSSIVSLRQSSLANNISDEKCQSAPTLHRNSSQSVARPRPRGSNVLSYLKEKTFGMKNAAEEEKVIRKSVEKQRNSAHKSTEFVPIKVVSVDLAEYKDKFIQSMLLLEKHMSYDASFYVLYLVTKLVDFFRVNPLDVGLDVDQFIRVLLSQMHLHQSDNVLVMLLSFLRSFCLEYRSTIFSEESELVIKLVEALMCLSNSVIESVRTHASSTLYIFVRTAYQEKENMDWFRVVSIISLNHTLQSTYKEAHLVNSINNIVQLAESDLNLQDQSEYRDNFIREVTVLSEQMQKLIKDILAVHQTITGKDTQKSEELLFDISGAFEDIPELMIMWLMQLANFHKKHEQHSECVQCYYRILAVLFDSLKRHEPEIAKQLPLDNFYRLCPQLMNHSSRSSIPRTKSTKFSEKSMLNLIKKTISALERAELYEHTIPLLKILTAKFELDSDLFNLSETYVTIGKMLEKVHTCTSYHSRLFATYYRLEFLGSAWGDLTGKSFVYKMPKLFKLHMMTNKVKEVFGDIELITNPNKVDISTLDPCKKYLQFSNVKPFNEGTTTSDSHRRRTSFEENMNVNQFYFESAFTPNSKKLSDKVTEIYKRKIVITVQHSFPDIRTRLPIISEEERILTPIETAIENINAQSQKLSEILEPKFTDIAQLQLVLQGSVRAGVNGGPKDIVESFLSVSERTKYSRQHVQQLEESCLHFLRLCEMAVKTDARLAKASQRSMHLELEKGFVDTKLLFSEYLDIGILQSPTVVNNNASSSAPFAQQQEKSIERILDGGELTSSNDSSSYFDYADQTSLLPGGLPLNRYYRLQNLLKSNSGVTASSSQTSVATGAVTDLGSQ